jgi:hypothetical protein
MSAQVISIDAIEVGSPAYRRMMADVFRKRVHKASNPGFKAMWRRKLADAEFAPPGAFIPRPVEALVDFTPDPPRRSLWPLTGLLMIMAMMIDVLPVGGML